MKFFLFSVIFFLFCFEARADSKVFELFWWPHHWHNFEERQLTPYILNGKHPHNQQWAHKDWYAEDWIGQKDNVMELVQGFYRADIIREQNEKDGVPVLIVGPNFYRLSGYDQRRVTHIFDQAFGITHSKHNGVFTLQDWKTHCPVGLYTKHGLQIQ